jgi:hypothetical protein
MPECLWVASVGGVESIILSVGGAESMMLSAGGTESMIPESAESIIISAPPTESMTLSALSALFGCVITLTAAATKKQMSEILTIAD